MFEKLTAASLALALVLPGATLATELKMDADGNGSVSMDEFTATMPEADAGLFAQIDTDADGALSADEIAAAEQDGMLPAMSSEG